MKLENKAYTCKLQNVLYNFNSYDVNWCFSISRLTFVVDCARILGEQNEKERKKKRQYKNLEKTFVTDSGLFTRNTHDGHHHHIQALQYCHFVFGECDYQKHILILFSKLYLN